MDNIFEPRFHKAWNEALLKEKKIRLKWYEEYGSKLEGGETFSDSDDGLEDDQPPCTCKDETRRVLDRKMDWPRKGATGTFTLTRVSDIPSEMIAPSAAVKGKLFEGVSHDGKGRVGYLKRRSREDPEDSYRSRVRSSWNYGWNHGKENELSCTDPEHCNVRQRAFYHPRKRS